MSERAFIEVTTSYSPFAFFYGMVTPTVQIDDDKHARAWGTSTFEVAPGAHVVAVSYPWFFFREAGRNRVTFTLAPGETKRITYRPWLIRFIPGRIRVEAALPAARINPR